MKQGTGITLQTLGCTFWLFILGCVFYTIFSSTNQKVDISTAENMDLITSAKNYYLVVRNFPKEKKIILKNFSTKETDEYSYDSLGKVKIDKKPELSEEYITTLKIILFNNY